MTIVIVLLLVSFFAAALLVPPWLIARSAEKIPARVPEEWVAAYEAEGK